MSDVTCTVEGCGRPARAKGTCQRCTMRPLRSPAPALCPEGSPSWTDPKGRKAALNWWVARIDRNNVRKAAFELETAGELRSQNDGGTFRFYMVETAQSSALPAVAKSATSVIDATYRDVTEPSSGRALVVSQPADSRTEAALRQHAVARARHQRQGGGPLPANFAMSLNAV